jgi:hypothetical protein
VSAGPHWSKRFQLRVWLTDHALARAAERKIPLETLALIAKTVMHHFDPEGT